MTPTTSWLEVRLPSDAGAYELWARAFLQAQELFGASVSAVLVRPCLEPPSSADLPADSLWVLGIRCPHLRHLRLCSVVLQTTPPDNLQPLSVFAQLDTLSIEPWNVDLDPALGFTNAVFLAFSHMPQLRVLGVHAPVRRPYTDPADNPTSLPKPPFRLESVSYTGAISISACALIISCSGGTLSELRVRLADDVAFGDEAQLVAALAQAAPRLRVLHLSAQADENPVDCLGPVFARLARLHTLRLAVGRRANTPLTVARDLLALAPAGIPLRTLRLDHGVFPADEPADIIRLAKQIVDDMPQTRRLTCVFLAGFYIGYRSRLEKRDLIEHWSSRRIRCKIVG